MLRSLLASLTLLTLPLCVDHMPSARAEGVGLDGRPIISPGKRRKPGARSGPRGKTPEEAEKGAAARKKTLALLRARRVSFDFVETPLEAVVTFLGDVSGVNFTIDWRRVRDREATVTLTVKNMRLEAALGWVSKLVGLEHFVAGDRHVILTTHRGVLELSEKILRTYRVADVTAGWKADELVAFIRRTLAPGTWDKKFDTSITYHAGLLAVRHSAEVHDQVARFLAKLRDEPAE